MQCGQDLDMLQIKQGCEYICDSWGHSTSEIMWWYGLRRQVFIFASLPEWLPVQSLGQPHS